LGALPAILPRLTTYEIPGERIEAPKFLLHLEERPRIADDRPDLQSVSHDAGICHQPFNSRRSVADDPVGVEPVERSAIPIALVKYGRPAKSPSEYLGQ
jgi:hypothetical protein